MICITLMVVMALLVFAMASCVERNTLNQERVACFEYTKDQACWGGDGQGD